MKMLIWLVPILALASCTREESPDPVRHIVLISLDTLRADRLNCYGYSDRILSENIDALARDGLLFENHISSSPWTTPAHMSMLTSLEPSAHGVTQSFSVMKKRALGGRRFNSLAASRTTLPEALQASGVNFATAAFTGGVTLDPTLGFGQGFDEYQTSMFKLNDANIEPMFRWLDQAMGRPFFLFWHTFEVHSPFFESDFLDGTLPDEKVDKIRTGLAELEQKLDESGGNFPLERELGHSDQVALLMNNDAYTKEVSEALYCGGVLSADRWIGRFIEELRRRELYDEALIVLTSDHGEEFSEHLPSRFYLSHGHTVYDELVHVPLIIKLPRQAHAGTRVSALTRTVDLMPTILDLAGIQANVAGIQGVSLRPLWTASEQTDPVAYSEGLVVPEEKKSIRTERYKLILSMPKEVVRKHGRQYISPDPQRELYDLRSDPGELENLWESQREQYADLVAVMEQRLRQHVLSREIEIEEVSLDDDMLDRLEALGYMNSDAAE